MLTQSIGISNAIFNAIAITFFSNSSCRIVCQPAIRCRGILTTRSINGMIMIMPGPLQRINFPSRYTTTYSPSFIVTNDLNASTAKKASTKAKKKSCTNIGLLRTISGADSRSPRATITFPLKWHPLAFLFFEYVKSAATAQVAAVMTHINHGEGLIRVEAHCRKFYPPF